MTKTSFVKKVEKWSHQSVAQKNRKPAKLGDSLLFEESARFASYRGSAHTKPMCSAVITHLYESRETNHHMPSAQTQNGMPFTLAIHFICVVNSIMRYYWGYPFSAETLDGREAASVKQAAIYKHSKVIAAIFESTITSPITLCGANRVGATAGKGSHNETIAHSYMNWWKCQRRPSYPRSKGIIDDTLLIRITVGESARRKCPTSASIGLTHFTPKGKISLTQKYVFIYKVILNQPPIVSHLTSVDSK